MNLSDLSAQELNFVYCLRNDKKFHDLIKKITENYEFKKPGEIDVETLASSLVIMEEVTEEIKDAGK